DVPVAIQNDLRASPLGVVELFRDVIANRIVWEARVEVAQFTNVGSQSLAASACALHLIFDQRQFQRNMSGVGAWKVATKAKPPLISGDELSRFEIRAIADF